MNRLRSQAAGAGGHGRNRGSAGFSMVEILLAAMVLAVGFIMLLPAFTVAMNESRIAIENSIVVQLGQNAEAYCRAAGMCADGRTVRLLDAYGDPNFTDANVASAAMQVYNFGAGGMPDDASIRVHGDPARSKYYWSLLYRFPAGQRSLLELWILVCKRGESGASDPLVGVRNPTLLPVSAAQGATTLDGGDSAVFLDPGSGVVTNQGEILRIARREDNVLHLSHPVRADFSGLYVVTYSDTAIGENACIGVLHTKVGF